MVWEVLEAWPDSLNAVLQKSSSLDAEDRSPHSCNEGPNADREVGTVHPEHRTDNDRERDVILGAHFGCQRDDSAANCKPKEYNGDGLPGCEP